MNVSETTTLCKISVWRFYIVSIGIIIWSSVCFFQICVSCAGGLHGVSHEVCATQLVHCQAVPSEAYEKTVHFLRVHHLLGGVLQQ